MSRRNAIGLPGSTDLEEQIRNFLLENREIGLSVAELTYDNSLITNGLIDSLAVLDIIAFLETQFDIQFDAEDLTGENFDRISSMAALVRSRMNCADKSG